MQKQTPTCRKKLDEIIIIMNICSLSLQKKLLMARPRTNSKVMIPPRIRGFIPMGYYTSETSPINLNIEEYESIRLLDYENLTQVESAKIMNVSRPTLTRIYERARNKIATALTESTQLILEGGNAIYSGNWYCCIGCGCRFNSPVDGRVKKCPLCATDDIQRLEGSK